MAQAPPVVTDEAPVRDAVMADLTALCDRRAEKYGTHLQAGNGRDHLQDAYEEALDLALYLKAEIIRRAAP